MCAITQKCVFRFLYLSHFIQPINKILVNRIFENLFLSNHVISINHIIRGLKTSHVCYYTGNLHSLKNSTPSLIRIWIHCVWMILHFYFKIIFNNHSSVNLMATISNPFNMHTDFSEKRKSITTCHCHDQFHTYISPVLHNAFDEVLKWNTHNGNILKSQENLKSSSQINPLLTIVTYTQ